MNERSLTPLGGISPEEMKERKYVRYFIASMCNQSIWKYRNYTLLSDLQREKPCDWLRYTKIIALFSNLNYISQDAVATYFGLEADIRLKEPHTVGELLSTINLLTNWEETDATTKASEKIYTEGLQ